MKFFSRSPKKSFRRGDFVRCCVENHGLLTRSDYSAIANAYFYPGDLAIVLDTSLPDHEEEGGWMSMTYIFVNGYTGYIPTDWLTLEAPARNIAR